MRSVSTSRPLGRRVERMSRVWGVLGVAFSATGYGDGHQGYCFMARAGFSTARKRGRSAVAA